MHISNSCTLWPRCNFCLRKSQQSMKKELLPFPCDVLICQPSASQVAELGQTLIIRDVLGAFFPHLVSTVECSQQRLPSLQNMLAACG